MTEETILHQNAVIKRAALHKIDGGLSGRGEAAQIKRIIVMKLQREIIITCLLGMSLVVAGCGGGKEPVMTAAPKHQSAPLPSFTPNVTGTTPDTGAKSVAAPPPAAIDFAATARPRNDEGQPMSDLELLNQALDAYLMRGGADTVPVKKGAQRGGGGAEATVVGIYPPALKDLSGLVTAGVIKSLPVAPPGKAYVLDAKIGRAALVDKK